MAERARLRYAPSRQWRRAAGVNDSGGRNRWLAMLVRVRESLAALLANDGEQPLSVEARGEFVAVCRSPFPVDGATPQAMADAFRIQMTALADAAIPRRRVVIGVAVQGSVEALELLIVDQQTQAADAWRGRSGGDC